MKIVSITRKHIEGAPDTFVVGMNDGGEGPAVDKIVNMRAGQLSMFPRDCYIVHFNKSTVRRIIPADEVKDIAYDKEDNKKEKAAAPELPEN